MKFFSSALIGVFFLSLSFCGMAASIFVDQKNLSSSDINDGSESYPLKTINEAASRSKNGDTVFVYPGIYRETISLGKNGSQVSFISKEKHAAIVTGMDSWRPDWFEYSNKICGATIDKKIFEKKVNPFIHGSVVNSKNTIKKIRPKYWDDANELSIGIIYADGERLPQVGSVSELGRINNSWMVSNDGNSIFFNCEQFDIKNKALEISTRDKLFYPKWRGLRNVTIDGFIFENASNANPFPHVGMVSVRSGIGWVIKNNIIRGASSIGVDVGSEYWDGKFLEYTEESQKKLILGGDHEVYSNEISDNGLSGIAGWTSPRTKIFNNKILRNNKNYNTLNFGEVWEEAAAVKLHSFYNGKIFNNLVVENNSHGLWIDNGHRGVQIYNNVIVDSIGSGIFIELGNGSCDIYNNIIAGTKRKSSFYPGSAVYSHDASDLNIERNLFYKNAGPGVFSRLNSDRRVPEGFASAKNLLVRGNIFYSNGLSSIVVPQDSDRSGFSMVKNNISIDEKYFMSGSINFSNEIINFEKKDARIVENFKIKSLLINIDFNKNYLELLSIDRKETTELLNGGIDYIDFTKNYGHDRERFRLWNNFGNQP